MSEVIVHSFLNALGQEEPAQNVKRPQMQYAPQNAAELRQIAIDYMYDMAKIPWIANTRIDYSFNNASLIYEPGQTYLGMIYNNNRNGMEAFREALDEKGVYQLADIGWDTAPGNSCATSIKHAWQMISPDVEYQYSVDMMPYYPDTGVLPVGNINWSGYDGKNTTNSILKVTDKNIILEAYAQAQPADGFMRYLDNGGHALMLTLEPLVVRQENGKIDSEQSFLFLTDQNNKMNTLREYPSSWKVDHKVSFEKAYCDGWLPVTVRELRQGHAPMPIFEVAGQPTRASLEAGYGLEMQVKSNYCIVSLVAELREKGADGSLLQAVESHPYRRELSLHTLEKRLNLKNLSPGEYCLSIRAKVGLGEAELLHVVFSA